MRLDDQDLQAYTGLLAPTMVKAFKEETRAQMAAIQAQS